MAKETAFKLTYATMFNPPEELHTRFEDALVKVKANLGMEHAMLIGGRERKAKTTFEDHSPINTDWVLGVFQQGDEQDAADSAAARALSQPGRTWRTAGAAG
jgi:1-pyrroline-5-carboxylate dehydrogenase